MASEVEFISRITLLANPFARAESPDFNASFASTILSLVSIEILELKTETASSASFIAFIAISSVEPISDI